MGGLRVERAGSKAALVFIVILQFIFIDIYGTLHSHDNGRPIKTPLSIGEFSAIQADRWIKDSVTKELDGLHQTYIINFLFPRICKLKFQFIVKEIMRHDASHYH